MFLTQGIPFRVACSVLAITALYNSYHIFATFLRCPDTQISHEQALPLSPTPPDPKSLFLTTEQCRVAFPLLTKEIDDAVAAGSFRFNRSADSYTGQVHARIQDGELYIISLGNQWSQEMVQERTAVLHQLHRAMLTSPSLLPNTIFTISVLDNPRPYTFSFSRPSLPNDDGSHWPIPHFSSWSWPKSFIGTLDEALINIARIEVKYPWARKIPKVVWRGTAHFNSIWNLNLRPALLATTKGKAWADVESMEWENQGASARNAIPVEDFCKYKYIIYTEGITYSGRLPFHQACASVIITPPPNFLLHTTHLLQPVFSSSFFPSSASAQSDFVEADQAARWPRSYPAEEANVVFVDREWRDLEQTVKWLEAHPDVAKAIGERQRRLIVDGGYFSQAAEVCYWRALIRGWDSVARIDTDAWRDKHGKMGMRWETFSLQGKSI